MLFGKFARSRSGNFSLMMALGLPAILTAAALAIDVSTLMRAKINLQNSLDAANLASSRLGDGPQGRQAAFQQSFRANVAEHGELGNAKAELSIDEGLNYIKTTAVASADVRLNFPFIFGADRHIGVSAGATEASNQLEVVLVLDNTGSMASNNRIGALRNAAKSLIDMLETAKSPTRTVKIAVVPFVTAVNVNGEGFDPAWIDMEGKAPSNGVNFPLIDGKRVNHMDLFRQLLADIPDKDKTGWNKTGWKGCVEARSGAYNISDDAPDQSKPETLFVPYFAPDDPGDAKAASSSYGNSASDYNNSYLSDTVDNTKLSKAVLQIKGLNINGLLALLVGDPARNVLKYVGSTLKVVSEKGPVTVGPNRACPTPITPLTDDFDKARKAVASMIEWNGSGTNVSEGLTWGMRVLSPQEPYAGGAPFRTKGTTKVILLLTDGENVVYGASGTPNKSDYTSYGYLASGRFGPSNTPGEAPNLSQTTAARNIDGWTLDVCKKLKDNDVRIFTVLLQADTAANRKLYTQCASSMTDYYPTNDVSQLESVFMKIGTSISPLRLTN